MTAPGTIVSPAPVYPEEAKAAGIQGIVELNASVTSAGTVANIVDVSGPQVLRQSAIDAVMQWQFKQPDDGKPVEGRDEYQVYVSTAWAVAGHASGGGSGATRG